jgi:hypothetical protein
MAQRMVHYIGGPADGHVQLMEDNWHPFMVTLGADTDGYYVMEYEVAGQRIGAGELELTNDDVIARWHQRSSQEDFMTGDIVIVKDTGARGMVFAPTTYVNDDETIDEGWLVRVGSNLMFVAPEQIRIATALELNDDESAYPARSAGSPPGTRRGARLLSRAIGVPLRPDSRGHSRRLGTRWTVHHLQRLCTVSARTGRGPVGSPTRTATG